MDLRRLRYFVAVAEEGNVGRAARRLNMSQPPLSLRIRELEVELDCALFVRGPRGMRLTGPGEVLLEEAYALLTAAERARERVREAAGARSLRVGLLGPGEVALSASVAADFRNRHPGVTVHLHQGSLADPTIGLADGLVDVAITWAPFDETGLSTRTVYEGRCIAAMRTTDPLAAKSQVTRDDLESCASVRLPETVDPLWRAFWQPTAVARGPEVHSLDECLHAVMWQGAIALVPGRTAQLHAIDGITYRPVEGVPPTRLVLAWRRGNGSAWVRAYVDMFGAPHWT
ncbi:LysR family transcriptional regulator [Streptomyces sp. NPDC052236]|uniref:LysR family transcriptional regulator n=1 Tax=Streptomyces sp. NPDC052236 TaxID=3365686 RepID=UPI0037D34BFA